MRYWTLNSMLAWKALILCFLLVVIPVGIKDLREKRLTTEENKTLLEAYFTSGGKVIEVARDGYDGDLVILESLTKSTVRIRARAYPPEKKIVLINDICTLELNKSGKFRIKEISNPSL